MALRTTRRVLVTGGCGFIGSQLVRELLEAEFEVVVIDNVCASSTNGSLDTRVEFYDWDLRSPMLGDVRADACIALAARNHGVGFFSTHQGEILHDNVLITANTFELCRKSRIPRVIYASSSCVFPDTLDHPLTEKDACLASPGAGYPFSKFLGEKFCTAYNEQYGMEYTIIRPFNVYGPGELPGKTPGLSHVIPDLIGMLLKSNGPIPIFGDGTQTRSFTHVRDMSRAIRLALESTGAANDDFNIGSDREISIVQLASILCKICRGGLAEVTFLNQPAFEQDIQRRAVDPRKALDILRWRAEISLEEGLCETVDWMRSAMPTGRVG